MASCMRGRIIRYFPPASRRSVRHLSELLREGGAPEVKFTGLTQTWGQLQQPLIWILSQTAGSAGKVWVNPVNFRLRWRGRLGEPRPRRRREAMRQGPRTTVPTMQGGANSIQRNKFGTK